MQIGKGDTHRGTSGTGQAVISTGTLETRDTGQSVRRFCVS